MAVLTLLASTLFLTAHRIYLINTISPARLDFIKPHGTGTGIGDRIETSSIGATVQMKFAYEQD
ncbi:hypothetical protein C2W62_41665 [Candidatus Entotheonella serta]|nr:hypothetical protein C2W62_41665 [Candidatus Entotheonella serta]